jgi:hypothetical protein
MTSTAGSKGCNLTNRTPAAGSYGARNQPSLTATMMQPAIDPEIRRDGRLAHGHVR